MPDTNRSDHMVALYGEVCKQAHAARILNRDAKTVRAMLDDGRLRWACAGTMVDVRSIAEYIEAPKENDRLVRLERRRQRDGISCRFQV